MTATVKCNLRVTPSNWQLLVNRLLFNNCETIPKRVSMGKQIYVHWGIRKGLARAPPWIFNSRNINEIFFRENMNLPYTKQSRICVIILMRSRGLFYMRAFLTQFGCRAFRGV